jgi:D-glycero-D-manno-heptose 1,7-bisphosphate phosphatase
MRPALFLDRDGVLIENRAEYVRTLADVAFLPGALQAMQRAAALPFAVVIVSNQAGVGRGLITPETAASIQSAVVDAVRAHGGRIDAAYFCPHRADENCPCRKPRPGMLLQAAQELGIDLAASWMVGDNITDMQAGRAAGARCLLVRSGLGDRQPPADAHTPFDVVDDVAAAVAFIERRCA